MQKISKREKGCVCDEKTFRPFPQQWLCTAGDHFIFGCLEDACGLPPGHRVGVAVSPKQKIAQTELTTASY
eukprot:5581746-Amphidinium_carterae.1